MSMLKLMCETLDLEKSGPKEIVVNRIMDFLIAPKNSGKAVPTPKRSEFWRFTSLCQYNYCILK